MPELFVRPDVRAHLDSLKAKPRTTFTIEWLVAVRPKLASAYGALDLPIGELAVTRDLVIPRPGGEIPLRLFDTRSSRGPGPVVVFFHHGGFVTGNNDTAAYMCGEIARGLDLPVISVDYRLAPEHPWPAAPDDAEAAARWIAENGQALRLTITSLVLCGDSAGGNLTIVTSLALRDRPAPVPVVLQFAMYPVVSFGKRYPSEDAFGEGYGLLFSTRPAAYLENPAFLTKVALLGCDVVNAVILHRGRHWARALASGEVHVAAKVSAAISLTIWAGAVLAGRWIGFLM